jgi:hypothetical protein
MALVRVDLTTGERLSLAENRPLFSSLTEDAASLFFVEAPFRVARLDKDGASGDADATLLDEATLQQLFPGERIPQTAQIATDAESLYVTINNQNAAQVGGVLKLDKASGAIPYVSDELPARHCGRRAKCLLHAQRRRSRRGGPNRSKAGRPRSLPGDSATHSRAVDLDPRLRNRYGAQTDRPWIQATIRP